MEYGKKTVFFSIVFGVVLLVFTAKLVLLTSRYAQTAERMVCYNSSNGVEVTPAAGKEYIFTVIMYAVLSLLRLLEYVIIGRSFFIFCMKQNVVRLSEFLTKNPKMFFMSILFLPYLFLGISIPTVGVYQEIELSKRLFNCNGYRHIIYYVYSLMDILRYIIAYTVRMMVFFTVLALKKYWICAHDQKPKNNTTVKIAEEGVLEGEDVQNKLEEKELKFFLEDWKEVSMDYKQRAEEYAHIGRKVKVINELFQAWFIIPWIIYFATASLKTYNHTRPWKTGLDGEEPSVDIPLVFYILYSLNQLIALIIPFVCINKMNYYHQRYHSVSRERQLSFFYHNVNRYSIAWQLPVEKNSSYDFLPRIWGTDISIDISSPLYIILLLAGLFLSITESFK